MGHQCVQQENYKMTSVQNILLRTFIVLGMAAAVVTILYLTPLPDQNFKSCERPCHPLDWPMICRVKINLELYQTMSGVCQDCPNNLTHCDNKFCASADGDIRGIVTANRQLPGPFIQVCQNDILVVDVINKIPGHSVTVHWRGQSNHENPFMDGAPMITQCPIPSYTTFQYKFRASSAGTHIYHAHADSDRTDGFFGALIVKQPDKVEPHRKLYDVDSKEHVILISEWSGDLSYPLTYFNEKPKSLLINGKSAPAAGSSISVFNVKKGKRYRFRVGYTGGAVGCPVRFSVDNHLLKIIALDGNPIKPYEVSSVVLSKGERFDFILKANQEIGGYLMRVRSDCGKKPIEGLAMVNYDGLKDKVLVKDTEVNVVSESKVRNFDTSVCDTKLGRVCLRDVKSLNKMPDKLKEYEVGRKIVLPFNFRLADKGTSQRGHPKFRSKIYTMNNLTFTYPPSPLLTQPEDVPENLLCNILSIPEKCTDQDICECVHIEHIPLGSSTEIILVDQGGDELEHIFHLHGYNFYVVGSNVFDRSLTIEEINLLDSQDKLLKRNFASPVLKDTVRVPKFGVVAIRFIANNAGFWMLRDEQSKGWTRGLDMVFQVGDVSEMVSTPSNFPTCGSFVGPDFFLL